MLSTYWPHDSSSSRFCTSFSFLIITKVQQKSFGYRSPPLEARAIASTRWHFCTNCSQWPAVAYEKVKNPEHPPTDDLCPEYVEKRKRKRCRWWEESVSNRRLILQYPVNFLIASPSSPARGSIGKSLLGFPGRECRHTCRASSSIFCSISFAGHVGGSGFRFRLEQKIGAMTQAAFTNY